MLSLQLDSIIHEPIINGESIDSISIKKYLLWLKSRLTFKYKEQSSITDKIDYIVNDCKIIPKTIDSDFIEKCCKKYYADFAFDRDENDTGEFQLGYTEKEKEDIKKFIINIYSTIIDTHNDQYQ